MQSRCFVAWYLLVAAWSSCCWHACSYAPINGSTVPPPPRFCILNDNSATPELFLEELSKLQEAAQITGKYELYRFFAYDRDVGHSALQANLASACPRFPLWTSFDWACHLQRKNGIFKFDVPFEEVQYIALYEGLAMRHRCQAFDSSISTKVCNQKLLTQEHEWMLHGYMDFPHCRRGCDCQVGPASLPSLCVLSDLVRILHNNEPTFKHKKNTLTLVLSGEDKPWLSDIERTFVPKWHASGWFRRIFYESVDKHIDGVHTFLKGLDMHYMLGREEDFLSAVRSATLDKPHLALGAWGKRGGVTSRTMDAIELGAFFASLPEDSRIHHRMVDIHSYFAELSQYKFMIAPRGNGIQSPKFLEAILVFTIPVTKSYACFEQLQSYGFPIVLVDDWHTITEAFLESEWARLSPSLPKARWIGTNRGVRSLYFQECTGDSS